MSREGAGPRCNGRHRSLPVASTARQGIAEQCPERVPPDLAHAVDAEIGVEHALDLALQSDIALGTIGQARRIGPLRQMSVIGALSAELLRNSPAG